MGAVETHWCRAALAVVKRRPSARDVAAALRLMAPPPGSVEGRDEVALGDVPW